MFLQSIGQSDSFTLYISFDSLTYSICLYFARPIGVWKNISLCYTIEEGIYHSTIILSFANNFPAALSERSNHVSPLYNTRPSHIFHVRYASEV